MAVAGAQPSGTGKGSPEYEQAFVRGRELFAAERWAEARAQFLAAYEIHPEPLLLFNVGSTYRREGALDDALRYYRRFLAEAPDDDEYRPLAVQVIAEIEEEQRAAAAAATPEPEPQPQPQPPPEPAPAPEPTDPALYAEEPIDAPPPAPPRSRPGRGLRIAGGVVLAGGAIGLGVAVHQGVRASSIERELEDAGGEWTPELADRYEAGERAESRALTFAIAGGVAVATGATLYYLGHRAGRRPARELVAVPVVTDGGFGVAIAGGF